jgi:hypothetical protein
MADQGNFLAGPAAPAVSAPARAVRQPEPAAPYRAPVSDGSNQGPMIGRQQKNPPPPAPQIAASPRAPRQNNDSTSGMSRAMNAMADQMHPVKRR